MPENKIDQQRFDAIQELSQIEMKLSDARVAFENLKKAEEEYLVERETRLSERLDAMVKSLEGVFTSFLENKDTFEQIKSIISEFSNKAVNLTTETKDVYTMLQNRIKAADELISAKMIKLQDESTRIIQERKLLSERLEVLRMNTLELYKSEKALAEEKLAFEEKWKELNK